jgi:hypothetical protein
MRRSNSGRHRLSREERDIRIWQIVVLLTVVGLVICLCAWFMMGR